MITRSLEHLRTSLMVTHSSTPTPMHNAWIRLLSEISTYIQPAQTTSTLATLLHHLSTKEPFMIE